MNARLVYFHGAWVWAALIAFVAAAVVGLVGLVSRRRELHHWSLALGRTGIVFWLAFLPMSLLVMQANWNGLFLDEPRFRLPLNFAIVGVLLQVGVSFFPPVWASLANLIFGVALLAGLLSAGTVLHPTSPIFESGATGIQLYFAGLVSLLALAALQMARGWHNWELRKSQEQMAAKLWKSPLAWFGLLLVVVAGFTLLGPAEKSLGTNVRVVYLHGAWVWAALACFLAAALVGLTAFIFRQESLHCWSRALGRTGLFFWITYLPISMWAMQTNWNGLFLSEPRWRLAIVFSLGGLLIQIGLALLNHPAGASAANIAYFLTLLLALTNTPNVMHPPAPILNSDAWRIQFFFAGLLLLTLLAAGQFARWMFRFEQANR